MTRGTTRRGFTARPSTPDGWVKDADRPAKRGTGASDYTARLTIDVTPELRGRIKIAAFERGVTVADMLRALLTETYPDRDREGR